MSETQPAQFNVVRSPRLLVRSGSETLDLLNNMQEMPHAVVGKAEMEARTDTEACAAGEERPSRLVLAARMKHGQDHQVRIGEQPLFGLRTRRFGRAHQLPQMAVACQSADVLQADPGQADDFIFRKNLLARLDSDHVGRHRPLALRPS